MPLTVEAPQGAHFEMEEVKTDRGQKSLGEHPLLVWDDVDAAIAHYGKEGVANVLDGTSLRVAFQSISRRQAAAGKTDDDIAKAQIEYKPGKRQGGVSTPVSRARKAAETAAEKSGAGDLISQLMEKIAKGEVSADDLAALVR